jgi:phage gp29-like protein
MFDSTYNIQRNYTRRKLQIKKAKEEEEARNAKSAKEAENQKAREAKIAKNMMNTSSGSSRPPPNNVTQQPGEAQIQPTLEPHSGGVSTLSTAPATSAVTSRWTRFRSGCCCASAQNADGHH